MVGRKLGKLFFFWRLVSSLGDHVISSKNKSKPNKSDVFFITYEYSHCWGQLYNEWQRSCTKPALLNSENVYLIRTFTQPKISKQNIQPKISKKISKQNIQTKYPNKISKQNIQTKYPNNDLFYWKSRKF